MLQKGKELEETKHQAAKGKEREETRHQAARQVCSGLREMGAQLGGKGLQNGELLTPDQLDLALTSAHRHPADPSVLQSHGFWVIVTLRNSVR